MITKSWNHITDVKVKSRASKYGSTQQTAEAVGSTSSTRIGGQKNPDRTANEKLSLGKEYLTTHLLINTMEQSPSWEASRFSANQEIFRMFWNPSFLTAFTRAWKYQSIPRLTVWLFGNKIRVYGEELLASRPPPKLEDHSLSAVRDCLFNICAATLYIRGRSSIRNLRKRHTVVTGTHLSRPITRTVLNIFCEEICR
jgi:hypothetical protein